MQWVSEGFWLIINQEMQANNCKKAMISKWTESTERKREELRSKNAGLKSNAWIQRVNKQTQLPSAARQKKWKMDKWAPMSKHTSIWSTDRKRERKKDRKRVVLVTEKFVDDGKLAKVATDSALVAALESIKLVSSSHKRVQRNHSNRNWLHFTSISPHRKIWRL